jgi:hypothetical protein
MFDVVALPGSLLKKQGHSLMEVLSIDCEWNFRLYRLHVSVNM